METLTPERQADEGYPPRQAGAAPAGMGEDSKGWGPDWIRKPVTKIISNSSSKTTEPSEHRRRASDHLAEQLNIQQHVSRQEKGARETVTEIVEPVVNDGAISETEGEPEMSRLSSRARFSHSSVEQGYSMMEHTEEDDKEYAETAKKFRSVFALSEAEELIDRGSSHLSRDTSAKDQISLVSCIESCQCRAASLFPTTTSVSDRLNCCTRPRYVLPVRVIALRLIV